MRHLGRKLYHIFGGLGLVSFYYILGREKSILFYGCLFLVVLVIDALRLRVAALNRFMMTHYSRFIRKSEEHKLTGTAPYVFGVGFSFFAYSPEVATAAVCCLAFGDVAATTVGESYGRTRIGGKSLEGTAAFIFASLIAGWILSLMGMGLSPGVMVLGIIVAACAEILPLPFNDNLAIPILSGAAMQAMMNFLK